MNRRKSKKQSVARSIPITQYIKGECMTMCPSEEVILRERERLLHILEMVPGTEKSVKPIADKSKVVKSFSRSAAGKVMLDPKHLRPPDVLLNTIDHLLSNVIINDRVPFPTTYDFIMDRLRSVRQDMVIQNASRAYCISILQPIIRFHIYSAYRLCEENISNFDPHINNTHLQECLKRLLCIYDDCEDFFKNSKEENDATDKYLRQHRPQFESFYLLMNLGSFTALTRGLNVASRWRTDLVKLSNKISLAYLENNFVRTCRLMRKLPPLHFALASLQLPTLRKKALKSMSVAYNSKNLSFPVENLKEILLYNTPEQVIEDCKNYGVNCKHNDIYFVKTDFKDKSTVSPTHLDTVDENLGMNDLPVLMLYGM